MNNSCDEEENVSCETNNANLKGATCFISSKTDCIQDHSVSKHPTLSAKLYNFVEEILRFILK